MGSLVMIILEIEKHSVVENREKLNFANSASEKAKSACISQPQRLYLKQYAQPSEHEKTEGGHKKRRRRLTDMPRFATLKQGITALFFSFSGVFTSGG